MWVRGEVGRVLSVRISIVSLHNYRRGKLRGLQLALVCGAEMHMKVNLELEKIKRDKMMGLVMMRNKASREEWLLEAMIVCLELYQTGVTTSSLTFITRSDGMRCAVRELRGMSEVRISESAEPPPTPASRLASQTQKPAASSRDSSCPPTSGWRSRILKEQQEQEERQREEARKEREKLEEERRKSEIQERKVIRVRRTSERRKRLDTINSESDYSVGLCLSVWETQH